MLENKDFSRICSRKDLGRKKKFHNRIVFRYTQFQKVTKNPWEEWKGSLKMEKDINLSPASYFKHRNNNWPNGGGGGRTPRYSPSVTFFSSK
jgi:hypothetical protein